MDGFGEMLGIEGIVVGQHVKIYVPVVEIFKHFHVASPFLYAVTTSPFTWLRQFENGQARLLFRRFPRGGMLGFETVH